MIGSSLAHWVVAGDGRVFPIQLRSADYRYLCADDWVVVGSLGRRWLTGSSLATWTAPAERRPSSDSTPAIGSSLAHWVVERARLGRRSSTAYSLDTPSSMAEVRDHIPGIAYARERDGFGHSVVGKSRQIGVRPQQGGTMTTPAPGTGDPTAAMGAPALGLAPVPPAPGPAAAADTPRAAAAAGPVEFYDSTRPWLIPAGSSHAALYYDGLYGTAGRAAAGDFELARWITIAGDARHAGIADYEPKNPVFDEPGILFDWASWRIEHGMRARVYVQRSLARRAMAELGRLISDPRCLFWIPTLDNRAWTAGEMAEDLAANWGAAIPVSQLWANQNVQDGRNRWDRSQLWGTW